MPQARAWTDKADSVICSMRGAGATWAMIGVSLGLSRNTVIERGRRLQAAPPPRAVVAVVADFDTVSEDLNRAPLRAGHPLTWGLLTDEPFPEGGE
jgi:hypothetical protein